MVDAGPPQPLPRRSDAFVVVAEGSCSKLSVEAMGDRRVLVFGDTGYDLAAWAPGDELAAAQAMVVLTGDGAARQPQLMEGLPKDDRGYVRGELRTGGAIGNEWLLLTSARYSAKQRGVLFERTSRGYVWGATGFERAPASDVVDRPAAASKLPAELPSHACDEGLRLVPLASAVTTSGGMVIVGRCAGDGPTNLPRPVLRALHGRAGSTSFEVRALPEAELDGIVNVSVAAGTDDQLTVVAWEPFLPLDRRRTYAVTWDGKRWSEFELEMTGAPTSVAQTKDGVRWLTAGSALYRLDASGRPRAVPLPLPHFVKGDPRDVYVHSVRAHGGEVWVEGSYRVALERDRTPVWASVVWAGEEAARFVSPSRLVYCDAREDAATATSLAARPPPTEGSR